MKAISRALFKDIEDLKKIEDEVFSISDGRLTKRAFAYHIKKGNLLLLCKFKKITVGYILFLSPRKRTYARLYSLAVLQEFRGEGIAGLLIKKALAEIDEKYDHTFLEVRESNKRAIELYEKFRFSKIRIAPGYYDDGENAIKMCRNI